MRGSLLPNLNMLDRVSSLNNFDPLLPRYHRDYLALIEAAGSEAGPLLRAAGVSQVFGETLVGAGRVRPRSSSRRNRRLVPGWPLRLSGTRATMRSLLRCAIRRGTRTNA